MPLFQRFRRGGAGDGLLKMGELSLALVLYLAFVTQAVADGATALSDEIGRLHLFPEPIVAIGAEAPSISQSQELLQLLSRLVEQSTNTTPKSVTLTREGSTVTYF